jgi:hypothetical protein
MRTIPVFLILTTLVMAFVEGCVAPAPWTPVYKRSDSAACRDCMGRCEASGARRCYSQCGVVCR